MIYVASVAPYAIKAGVKGIHQTNIKDIRAKLPDDPKISKMDVLCLSDKDITSLQGKSLINDIKRRHEDIRVLIIYRSESNGKLIPSDANITKVKVSKLSSETVERTINNFIDGMDISSKETTTFSNDDIDENAVLSKKTKKREFSPKPKEEKKKSTGWGLFRRSNSDENLPDTKRSKTSKKFDDYDDDDDNDIDDLNDLSLSSEEVETLRKEAMLPTDYETPENINSYNIDSEPIVEDNINIEITQKGFPTEMPEPRRVESNIDIKQSISMEERIQNISMYDGYEVIKKALTIDTLNRALIKEDTEYAGCKFTLEQWDREILDISRRTNTSPEEKFRLIRELGFKRSERTGTLNNKLMEKISSMMTTITLTCEKEVKVKVEEIRRGLAAVVDMQYVNASEEESRKLLDERNKLIVELKETLMNIVEIYKLMNFSVEEFILQQGEGLPSKNDFIANQFVLEKELFIPANAGRLAAKISSDLHNNLLTFSQMEKSVESLITIVFKLIDKDSAIIQEAEERYKRLRAVRVEETVTLTHILKNILRVFVGPDNVGVTSTALTFAGLRARRHNTILIDLRNSDDKLIKYGVESMDLQDFLQSNIQDHFVVCKGYAKDILNLDDILMRLETKVDYYSSINILLDNNQVDFVNRAVEKALSVNIVTDSAIQNVEKVRMFLTKFYPENVGTKLVVIDAAVERLEFLQKINADENIYQLIGLPYMTSMRACSIRQEPPYEREDISTIFEEAFR